MVATDGYALWQGYLNAGELSCKTKAPYSLGIGAFGVINYSKG